MIRRMILIVLCCISVYGSFGQGKRNKAAKPVNLFTINKKTVLADEFIYLYKKNHQLRTEGYSKADVLEYLQLFINFKLKVEEARNRGMDTTSAFIAEYTTYRNELIKPYLPDGRIIDSLVSLTFERLKEEVRASHILVSVKNDATPQDTLIAYNKILGLKKRIEAGEEFETVAAAHSEDPSARVNKGDLGFFTAMQMVYPFENTAYNTSVGEIGGPVRTQFGYHLIKVTDRQAARGEIEVSHIMIRTGGGKEEEEAKSTIFEIYDQLGAGASWDELCREYSEDLGSRENGGRLRPFGVGAMATVPEFEQMSFSLQNPGDLSDPFRSSFGWHIVRLERKILLPTLAELTPQLKSRVTKDERLKVSKEMWQAKFKKQFDFTENSPAKEKIVTQADSSLLKGNWTLPGTIEDTEWLFTLRGKPYTTKGFAAYVQKNQRPATLSPKTVMENMYAGYVEEVLHSHIEEKIGLDHPEFSMLANEYYEGILLFEIMEKEVWNKAANDSLGQLAFYERNKANYKAGERIKATFYSSSDSSYRNQLKSLLEKGDSVALQAFLERNRVRQESGLYEKGDRTIAEKIVWSEGIQFTQSNGMYYLVRIQEIVPPGNKTFEEARAAVISDFQQELEKNWVALLQKKYRVKVNEKGKHYALEKLQQ